MSEQRGTGFDQKDDAIRTSGINYLLVIAIDEYAHALKLHNCVRDAKALIDVLTRKYRFDPEHVQTIYNKDATRENILETLYQYRKKIKPDDTLMIYFSGHGEVDGEDGFWVPVEAQSGRFVQYIPGDDIMRQLKKVNCFHILVIVDACFSGTIFSTHRNINPGTDAKRSRWGLVSSNNRQVALDGTPGANSPFATSLVKHLQKNEVDIGLFHLASNVIDDMHQPNQTPVCQPLNVEGHELGQFIFRLRGQDNFVDPRDGKVYRTVEINGKVWMAQNLDFDVEGYSWYYVDTPVMGKLFGRLYTWEGAIKACPPGWHLPTFEEWESLAIHAGGYWDFHEDRIVGDPQKAYNSLIDGGKSGFSALLGGGYFQGGFNHINKSGCYWCTTEYIGHEAGFFCFGPIDSTGVLYYSITDNGDAISCRCVKD